MSNVTDPQAHDFKSMTLSDLVSTLQVEAGLEKPRSLPPLHLWNPTHCGDIGLEIRRAAGRRAGCAGSRGPG
jgi:hypothetical protein